MSTRPETLRLVRQWVEKAEEDLTNARHTLTLTLGCPLGTVCFHAQQCAEKYLKALLTLHSVAFPKTHDLPNLLNMVPASVGLNMDASQVSPINRYSVEARYPGEWDPVTRADAEEAVAIAHKIRDAIRQHLPAPLS
jgi:HEPN domain-containing protein